MKGSLLKKWAQCFLRNIGSSNEYEILRNWLGKRTEVVGIVELKKEKEFSDNFNAILFDMQKFALLDKWWIRSSSGTDRCVRVNQTSYSYIGMLFHHNPTDSTTIPFVDIPGLEVLRHNEDEMRAVLLEKTREKEIVEGGEIMRDIALKYILKMYRNEVIEYYLKLPIPNTMKLRKAISKDYLSNVVINGVHISSESCALIRDNIYRCDNYKKELRCRNHQQCQSEIISYQKLYDKEVPLLRKRLGLGPQFQSLKPTRKHPTSSSSSDSSDSSDSSSDSSD